MEIKQFTTEATGKEKTITEFKTYTDKGISVTINMSKLSYKAKSIYDFMRRLSSSDYPTEITGQEILAHIKQIWFFHY